MLFLIKQVLNYEKNIVSVLNSVADFLPSLNYASNEDSATSNISTDSSKSVSDDNNVLLISEKDQLAYLPYHYSDLEEIYQNGYSSYCSIEDIINNLYVLPLKRFEHSSISRFKEAFNLVYNKEKGSFTHAIELGLELMFKYELNPIIIAACRNLDELDIYLDCLDENEIYDFDCFEIKFEMSPQLAPKSSIKFSYYN